jgi:hypothetical protein
MDPQCKKMFSGYYLEGLQQSSSYAPLFAASVSHIVVGLFRLSLLGLWASVILGVLGWPVN